MSSGGEHEPNEVEAWKLMMDSMIKFIAASTKLMNTINDKAERASVISVIPSECEEGCLVCPTKSPKDCGTCATLKAQTTGAGDKGPKVCEGICNTAVAAAGAAPAAAEPTAAEEGEAEAAANEAVLQLLHAAPAEEAPAEEAAEEEAPAEEAPAEEAPAEEAPAEEAPAEGEGENAEEGGAEKPKDDADDQGKSKYCTCKELRIIKKQAILAGVDVGGRAKGFKEKQPQPQAPPPSDDGCTCTGDSQQVPDSRPGCSCKGGKGGADKGRSCKCGDHVPEGEPPMCSCEMGPKEKRRLTNELAEKLNNAQEQIARLQEEMGRLQRLEQNRRTQSAALYKQIMKDGPPLGLKKCGPCGLNASGRPGAHSNANQSADISYSEFGRPLANSSGMSSTINSTQPGSKRGVCPSPECTILPDRSPRSFMATQGSETHPIQNSMDYSNTSNTCGASMCRYKKGPKAFKTLGSNDTSSALGPQFASMGGSCGPFSVSGTSERQPGFRSMAGSSFSGGGKQLGFASLGTSTAPSPGPRSGVYCGWPSPDYRTPRGNATGGPMELPSADFRTPAPRGNAVGGPCELPSADFRTPRGNAPGGTCQLPSADFRTPRGNATGGSCGGSCAGVNLGNSPPPRVFQNNQGGCSDDDCWSPQCEGGNTSGRMEPNATSTPNSSSRMGPNATSTPNSSVQNMPRPFNNGGCYYEICEDECS